MYKKNLDKKIVDSTSASKQYNSINIIKPMSHIAHLRNSSNL